MEMRRAVTCLSVLSNDPDKNCSILYCSAAICFPHIEMDVFSYGETRFMK